MSHRGVLRHSDGGICLEGSRKVPRGWRACCDAFDARTKSCTFDVRYEWLTKRKVWGIAIDGSAGGGFVTMAFCPHCGSRISAGDPKSFGIRVLF